VTLSRSAAVALALAAGAGLSVQSFTNGRLGTELGSPELAAVANNLVALTGFVVLTVASGALVRAWVQLRTQLRRRMLWYLVPSVNGGLYSAIAAAGAPRLGLALLTIAIVCGQTAAGVAVDRLGLSTAGAQALSLRRAGGVALALTAMALGLIGERADVDVALLIAAAAAGALYAVQQATMTHLRRVTGEPLAAGLAHTIVGSTAAVVVALIVTGGDAPGGWHAPAGHWVTGGLLAVAITIVAVAAVRTLGVLQFSLGLIAGQSAGALALDVVAPAPERAVTAVTVASLLLTLAAVAASAGRLQSSSRCP
jgi:transporter family-2 protein